MRPFRLARALLLSVVACVTLGAADAAPGQTEPPAVAAASDLRFALDEAIEAFRAQTGIGIRAAYGSSGNLARQIAQGAPFELFLSADEAFVLDLAGKGLLRDEGELYAIGRIALFAPSGSALEPDAGLEGLRRKLENGGLRRFAIANPEHAPYGRAAEQALRSAGIREALADVLVFGESVSQAARFAAGGNADGGIVAYSLALAPPFRERGRFALLSESLHEPLRQRMALTRRASPDAEAFYAYLRSDAGRDVLARYGFALPER